MLFHSRIPACRRDQERIIGTSDTSGGVRHSGPTFIRKEQLRWKRVSTGKPAYISSSIDPESNTLPSRADRISTTKSAGESLAAVWDGITEQSVIELRRCIQRRVWRKSNIIVEEYRPVQFRTRRWWKGRRCCYTSLLPKSSTTVESPIVTRELL